MIYISTNIVLEKPDPRAGASGARHQGQKTDGE